MASDDIGERAQWIFCLLMTQLCGRDEPLFRPRFLGDKFPTFDYIVELVDRPNQFFFAQVKGTTQGYTSRDSRLRVQVSQQDIDRMVSYPVPTYLIGIDNPNEVGFLLSINEARKNLASLTTRFKIDRDVLRDLYEEVLVFWSTRDMRLRSSRFQE